MTPRRCTILLAAAAALACSRGAPAPAAPRIDEPPAKTLEMLETSPHGLASLSDDDRVRFDMVKRDPGPYVSVIAVRYAPGTIAALAGDARAAGAFITNATLLGQLDDPRTPELLEAWWLELQAALSAGVSGNVAPLLDLMQHATLNALGSRPRDRVVSRVLDDLERMDRTRRADEINYLLRSSKGNTEVIRRLRAMYDAPASPLYGDQYVANAIARLSGAR